MGESPGVLGPASLVYAEVNNEKETVFQKRWRRRGED